MWPNLVYSHAGLGVSGLVLLTANIASGMGLSAFLGLTFNPATSQIAPLLALGMGMNSIYLMTQTYSDITANVAAAAVSRPMQQQQQQQQQQQHQVCTVLLVRRMYRIGMYLASYVDRYAAAVGQQESFCLHSMCHILLLL